MPHAHMSTIRPSLTSYWVKTGEREEIAMKRIMIALASILIIGLVAVVSATAEPISKRLYQQKMRIYQGVYSGALTGPE